MLSRSSPLRELVASRYSRCITHRYWSPKKRRLSFQTNGGSRDSSNSSSKVDIPIENSPSRHQGSNQIIHDGNELETKFRLWAISRKADMKTRLDNLSSRMATRLSLVGGKINEITGYQEIDVLKRRVTESENRMDELRKAAKMAKQAHDAAVSRRSSSQRIVNELLQRKSAWTDDDVSLFTQLIRQDHLSEQEESRAKAAAEQAEAEVDNQFNELMRIILARYHEEQIWSDKIRSASTYGSLAALGLNLLVFILAIVVVEPWKRDRLLKSFEQRVAKMNKDIQETLGEEIHDLREQSANQQTIVEDIARLLNGSGEDKDQESVNEKEKPLLWITSKLGSTMGSDTDLLVLPAVTIVIAFTTGMLIGSRWS